VSHESRLGRIEEMLADLLHPERELPDDTTLARRICHVLVCGAHGVDTANAVALAKLLHPEADEAWLRWSAGR
jgi:hypothetical protein